ncbi:hypothetical protein B566_EDAN015118 [Ephemera danica]|nr:hypothetical protein B566_EDAN015118 [Ephemera danica]
MKVFKISSLLLLVGVIGFGEAIKCYDCGTDYNGQLCNNLSTNTTASARFLIECPRADTECVLVKFRTTRRPKKAYTMVGRACFDKDTLGSCEDMRERLRNSPNRYWNFRCEACNTDGCNRA